MFELFDKFKNLIRGYDSDDEYYTPSTKPKIKKLPKPLYHPKTRSNIIYEIENYKYKDFTAIVFQGGGAKGIMYAGVIKALSDLDILKNIDFYSGTSIGALTSLLLYLGYDTDYLLKWIMSDGFVYSIFGDNNVSLNMTYGDLLSAAKNIWDQYGIYDHSILINLVFKLVKNAPILKGKGRGDETFLQLYEVTGKTLLIPGTNLNKNKIVYFSHELNGNVPVYIAVSISMCAPIIFSPIYFDGDFWVDGGVIQNLPVYITKRYKNADEILCISIQIDKNLELEGNMIENNHYKNSYNQRIRPYGKIPSSYEHYNKYCINSLFSYFGALLDANNKFQNIEPNTETSLIILECGYDLTTFNFDLSPYLKEKYIKYAYNKTINYFV